MDSFVPAILVVLLCGLASTVTAIDCYQCNLECRNASGEGCNISEATEYTDYNATVSQRVACENATTISNCVSCVKVKTTVRRYIYHSEFTSVDIISKICQKDNSLKTEDTCRKSGPAWATDTICHCFSDLCNSATENIPFLIPILSCILFHLL